MKWKIITVGKPALPWARAAVEDYLGRLPRFAQVEWIALREGTTVQTGARALEASSGTRRIVLDERGRQFGSVDFAKWIERQELAGLKCAALLVGGADGHSPEVRQDADEVWSLSSMTLQHELALVVLLEQLYRACTIMRGGPYHRP
ncbi:MAG: 23S rRNA (pseudouridine(1915)-N(3))-methyltransferase RlmH [Roseimicrobium sp.]